MENPQANSKPMLLKPIQPVGIVGYGAYVPRYRLPAKEVARIWTGEEGGIRHRDGMTTPGLSRECRTGISC